MSRWRFRRLLRKLTLLWVFLAIMLALGAFGLTIYHSLPDGDSASRVGQTTGALEALFGALAFGGVIYTLLLQRRELELQRRELQLTRAQVVEQTRIHSQRLAIELARRQPILRYEAVESAQGSGPPDGEKPSPGRLVLRLFNDGGSMHHAEGRVYYGEGAFAELFPRDQDEDGELSCSEEPDGDIERYIPAKSALFLFLPCRLYPGQSLGGMNLTFDATLVVRYLNSLNLPRVSEYQLSLWHRNEVVSGRLFLLRDVDPFEAMNAGLLDSYPFEFARRSRDSIDVKDLYPDLRRD